MNLEAIIFAGVLFIGISAMLMESLVYLIMRIGEEIDTIKEAKKEARKEN